MAVRQAQCDTLILWRQIVLTATFRTLPDRTPNWAEHVDRAVGLSVTAGVTVAPFVI